MSADNNCTLTGRLTKEPEVRPGNNGKSFVTFSIAVNRNYKDQSGQRPTDFFDCSASVERIVNYMSNFCHKGNLITVTGEFESRTYTNRDGVNVKTFNLRANDVTNRTTRAENAMQNGNGMNNDNYGNGQQYGNPQMPPTPSPMAGMGTDIPFDEEVPF